jgi:tetratricopeptide (TPR) repeat protein
MRLLAVCVVPLMVLAGLELGLRLIGYGYDTHFFKRIQINGQSCIVPNEEFGYRFFPPAIARSVAQFKFPADKSTNTFRIFVLGESAAAGEPDSSYGFARYLEVLLRDRYPGVDFESVCVAMTAIDSSTILPIARECARHQGDMWCVYMGNNEMVGPFGAETSYGLRAPSRAVIHTILAVKATRTGQLLDSLIRRFRNSSAPKQWGGMKMFLNGRIGYDDPARLRAYSNFKGNLDDILQSAQTAQVPVILSTMAVNLRQCAPLASIHGAAFETNREAEWTQIYEQGTDLESTGSCREALELYRKAEAIDPQFADLQYRMGTCELALTNLEAARRCFELARDYDALDFRSDSRINNAIKEAAARHAAGGVRLLDAAEIMARNSPAGIPGLEVFYEHVHFNFNGNYLLALNFAEQARGLFPAFITNRDKGSWASAELCNRRLAVTVWDRQRVWQPILSRVSTPPFTGQFNHTASLKLYQEKVNETRALMDTQTPEQALQVYEAAVALSPDDYFLHGNFQRFLEAGGNLTRAIAEAKRCCELVPQLPGGYYYTGTLLVRAGKIDEAVEYFSRAVSVRGDYAEALTALGEIAANRQKNAEAADWFNRALRADPDNLQAWISLGFLLQNEGKLDAARENYAKAAGLQPEGPADYFSRANEAPSPFQKVDAVECLQGVARAKPDFWQARFQLGMQLAARGDTESARKEFAEAIRYRPDFSPAHLNLSLALAAEGKLDQALAEARTALQLNPADGPARHQVETLENTLRSTR